MTICNVGLHQEKQRNKAGDMYKIYTSVLCHGTRQYSLIKNLKNRQNQLFAIKFCDASAEDSKSTAILAVDTVNVNVAC